MSLKTIPFQEVDKIVKSQYDRASDHRKFKLFCWYQHSRQAFSTGKLMVFDFKTYDSMMSNEAYINLLYRHRNDLMDVDVEKVRLKLQGAIKQPQF
jgi:hypothetical protein